MSEQEITTQDTPSESEQDTPSEQEASQAVEAVTEAEKTSGEILENLQDVKVSDQKGFTAAFSHLLTLAESLRDIRKVEISQRREVGEARLDVREYMLLPSGIPDWAGTSKGYKTAVEMAEFKLYMVLGPDEKRSLDANVRKYVEQYGRTPHVVQWILTNEQGLEGCEGFAAELDAFLADSDAVMKSPSDKLIERVQWHYDHSYTKMKPTPVGLKVPTTFPAFMPKQAEPVSDGRNDAGPGKGKTASVGQAEAAVGGLNQFREDVAASIVLRAFTDLSRRIRENAGGEIHGRPYVTAATDRVEGIAFLTGKILSGESLSDAEAAKLDSFYWTTDDEASKLDRTQ